MASSSALVGLLLGARTVLYRCVSPLEAAWSRIKGLPPLPPLWLRRHVGAAPRSRFEHAVSEGVKQLGELLGADREITSVLDLGCGCGAMVPHFQQVLPSSGSYLGVDIHQGSVSWCTRRYAHDPRFEFGLLPSSYPAILERRYDLVLAKSLFTHLLEAQASEYLATIRDVLEPQGRLVLTAFLFDSSGPVPALPHLGPDGNVRLRRLARPEAAVGYERAHFLAMLELAGLAVLDARYWFWPGHHPRLSAQDVLVCGAIEP